MLLVLLAVALPFLSPVLVAADAISGYIFTSPVSGSTLDNDFEESWYVGERMYIAWVGNDLITSPADLWLTHFDSNDYSRKILREQNITYDGSYNWTIELSDQTVADPKFVLRWSPRASTNTWSESLGQQSSRGFYIYPSNSSTSKTSSTTTNSAPTGTSSTTSPPTATHTGNPAGGLSTGAKAGIGIGASIGGIAFLVLGLLVGRRCLRSSSSSRNSGTHSPAASSHMVQPPHFDPNNPNPHGPYPHQHHQHHQHPPHGYPSQHPHQPMTQYSQYGYNTSPATTAWSNGTYVQEGGLGGIEPKGPPGGQTGPVLAPDSALHETDGTQVGELDGQGRMEVMGEREETQGEKR